MARKPQAGPCRPLTDEELARLRAFFQRQPRELALMEVMLSSARVGEALALKVADVYDFAKQDVKTNADGTSIIPIHGEKGDAGSLLLTPQAIAALRAWLKGLPLCPDAPVFPSGQTREAVSDCRARQIFVAAFRELGLVGQLSTHAFRHTWAQKMADAGMSAMWLMQAGRWRSIESVLSYVRFSANKQALQVAQIMSVGA